MYKIDACPFCGQSYNVKKEISAPLSEHPTLDKQREAAPEVRETWTRQDFSKNLSHDGGFNGA